MKKSKFLFGIIIAVIVSVGILFFNRTSNKNRVKNSIIYNRISNYDKDRKLELLTDTSKFKAESAEKYFFDGLKYYYSNNYLEAEKFFKRSELKNSKDPILNLYTQFFLNNCIFKITGEGDIQRVRTILRNIKKYPLLANDTDFIWDNLSTILSSKNSRNVAIYTLQKYIDNTSNLEYSNRLKLKGYISIFLMLNEEYADSIYLFYQIISEADKIKEINTKNSIKIKAYEYIAHMHFLLEDYDTAIEKYNLAISLPIDDKIEEAKIKYGSYTNRTASYIQLKNYESAKFYSQKTFELLPFLPKEIINGVKTFVYNNLARIAIYENNFDKATEYLTQCDFLLENSKNLGILNNDMFVNLSYCELYIAQKKYSQAEKLLNELLEKNNSNQLGFEGEIYGIQMQLYEKTNQFEKYSKAHEKYFHTNQDFNLQLRKDYLKFAEKSFIADKLREEEKLSLLKIRILIFSVFIILLLVFLQIRKITNLKKNNFTDQLTNVYNRKYLKRIYENLDKSSTKSFNFGVLMIDIDYFKKYNDSYGHVKGDYVIKNVAEVLIYSVRKNDSVIRYGGEEFLIILKEIQPLELEKICKKIIENLKQRDIPHEFSLVSDRLTLSIGGTNNLVKTSEDLASLIKEADSALYQAKESGRNRYFIFKK